jgi:hypothetical protein
MTIAKSLADIITPTGGLTAAEIVASSTLNVSGATTLAGLTANGVATLSAGAQFPAGVIPVSQADSDGTQRPIIQMFNNDVYIDGYGSNAGGGQILFRPKSGAGTVATALTLSGINASVAGTLGVTGQATIADLYIATSVSRPATWDTNAFLWSQAGVGLHIDAYSIGLYTGASETRAIFLDASGHTTIDGNLGVAGATTAAGGLYVSGPYTGNVLGRFQTAGMEVDISISGGVGRIGTSTTGAQDFALQTDGIDRLTLDGTTGDATFASKATANQLVGSPSAFNPISSGAANAGLLLSGSYGGGVGWRDGANSDWGAWIQNSGDDWVLGFNTTQGASLANLITVNGPTGNAAFAGGVTIGTFSPSGASAGQTTNSAGLTDWSTATTNSINAWAFFNPTGNVGAIKTSGSATVYTTSSDPRLKSEFVAIDDALAAQMVKDAVENKWVGVFNFKADDSEPVAGYNAHALIDNQLGYGGSEGEGPREAEIGDVYEVATYEQATDEDGELLFDDVTEIATRPKTWQKPIMETFDEVVPAVTEQQAVINEETGEPEIITVVVEEETTRKAERQKTEPFTETVTVAEAIVDGVLIPEHEETKTTDKPMFTTENVVDQAGNVVTEEYQKVVGTEPRMVEVTPEKVVSPAGVDQSKRVPLLEAALYNALKRIEALEAK